MRSWLKNLASELLKDILSEKAIPALSSGITSGTGLLIAQIAFATFIFSGPLASHSSQGVGMVLFLLVLPALVFRDGRRLRVSSSRHHPPPMGRESTIAGSGPPLKGQGSRLEASVHSL